MPTLDQPLFAEGFCDKCDGYYCIMKISDEARGLIHKCGEKIHPITWRRLIVSARGLTCPHCMGTVYREMVDGPAATFVIVDGNAKRHMCEVPLRLGEAPYGQALHPDDIKAKA